MNVLIFLCLFLFSIKVKADSIANKIVDYFKSETVKEFHDTWVKTQVSYSDAISKSLGENYGNGNLNVFVLKPFNKIITKGFIFTDNVVKVLLLSVKLREFPVFLQPDASLRLHDNVLTFEGMLSEMFVDSNYILIRNKTNILYKNELNPYKDSPFALQKVSTVGDITIVAENCYLQGFAVVTLVGQSVNLGQTSLQITNCKFSVEISSPEFEGSPVIVPLFAEEQALQLERLLTTTYSEELIPTLQGTLLSIINTQAIFGDRLPKYRHEQERIFKETLEYQQQLVREYVEIISSNSLQTKLPLDDAKLQRDDTPLGNKDTFVVSLTEVTLTGLDSLYSSNRGGPIKIDGEKISEDIIFNSLQVRGKLQFKNSTVSVDQTFAVELSDVIVTVVLKINTYQNARKSISKKIFKSDEAEFKMIGLRSMDFSLNKMNLFKKDRRYCHSFVSGYLINEVPKSLLGHLSKQIPEVLKNIDGQDKSSTSDQKNNYHQDSINTNENHSDEKQIDDKIYDEKKSDREVTDGFNPDGQQTDGQHSDEGNKSRENSNSHNSNETITTERLYPDEKVSSIDNLHTVKSDGSNSIETTPSFENHPGTPENVEKTQEDSSGVNENKINELPSQIETEENNEI